MLRTLPLLLALWSPAMLPAPVESPVAERASPSILRAGGGSSSRPRAPAGREATILLLATIAADLIVLIGFVVASFFVVKLVDGRVERALQRPPTGPGPGDLKLLAYAASVLFWPAALGFGLTWLNKAESAREGRVCLLLGLAHLGLAVLAAIAIVTGVAIAMPGWLR